MAASKRVAQTAYVFKAGTGATLLQKERNDLDKIIFDRIMMYIILFRCAKGKEGGRLARHSDHGQDAHANRDAARFAGAANVNAVRDMV